MTQEQDAVDAEIERLRQLISQGEMPDLAYVHVRCLRRRGNP